MPSSFPARGASDDDDDASEPLVPAEMMAVLRRGPPRTVAAGDAICALMGTRVRVRRGPYRGWWGSVRQYDALTNEFGLVLDHHHYTDSGAGDSPFFFAAHWLQRLTPETGRGDTETHFKNAEVNLDAFRDAANGGNDDDDDDDDSASTPFSFAREGGKSSAAKKRSSKRTRTRKGIKEGVCPCCDEPMARCTTRGGQREVVAGTLPDMVRYVAGDDAHGLDAAELRRLVRGALQAASDGHATVRGCECHAYERNFIRFARAAYSEGDVKCCQHTGNNPELPALKAVFDAGLADAVLNVAWMRRAQTRFAALELYVALIACSPPPYYVHNEGFTNVTMQLALVFGTAAAALASSSSSKTTQTHSTTEQRKKSSERVKDADAAAAALMALFWCHRCAIESRPVDFRPEHFFDQFLFPLETICGSDPLRPRVFAFTATETPYRDAYEKRLGKMAEFAPRHVPFVRFHRRRLLCHAKCDACGKTEPHDGSTLLRECKNCRSVLYCSKECQTLHWKGKSSSSGSTSSHKTVCADLAALFKRGELDGWRPSTAKRVCFACGFGPTTPADLAAHARLSGHEAAPRNQGWWQRP